MLTGLVLGHTSLPRADAPARARALFRHSKRDAWLAAAALVQGVLVSASLVLLAPANPFAGLFVAALFGVSVWWCSNTVSHNHLHNPLFRSRRLNLAFSFYLTLLLSVPQSIWRARHLRHHAGEPARSRPRRMSWLACAEIACVAASWLAIAAFTTKSTLVAYACGYGLGMLLCVLQGKMEHALGHRPERGISYYGRLYNFFWFNDGHHSEHHRWPSEHWTRLPSRRSALAACVSGWAPCLRWLEGAHEALDRTHGWLLELLELPALRSRALQTFLVDTHERALCAVLARLPASSQKPRCIGIVGGGLFPRSVIVLRRVFPDALLIVIDESAESIRLARRCLREGGHDMQRVAFIHASFCPFRHRAFDLVLAPLGFVGEKKLLGEAARLSPVVTHDWIWRRGGEASALVSPWLLKRVTLRSPPLRKSSVERGTVQHAELARAAP